ncbi:MAG TPA: hypothetical protein VNO22_01970 [Planctomycetota bacterium]|jgi:hypothetical protein|nr:hypothetical protein [Planctomycetota bacterium]
MSAGDEGIEVSGGLEYVQPIEKLIPSRDPSRRVEPKGVIEAGDLGIFLTEAILRDVWSWSLSDLRHELGGVFVGDLYAHQGLPYVEIGGYIRARHYRNGPASFRFTHDSWSAITRERIDRYGEKLLVGWHHTHPGYGVFLSGMDLFIHQHFFNLPWMFALVVDPCQEELGFFQWKRGRVVPCGFFFVR